MRKKKVTKKDKILNCNLWGLIRNVKEILNLDSSLYKTHSVLINDIKKMHRMNQIVTIWWMF